MLFDHRRAPPRP